MGREYHDVDDPALRAVAIAHAIRLGKRPPVGDTLGFSARISEVEAESIDTVDMTRAVPLTDKAWFQFTITQADIDAAHKLINDQAVTYREPKTSTMKLHKPTCEIAEDGTWIKCLVCGKTSYNQNDVIQKYCAVCHKFQDSTPNAKA
jgi:hypothetical protein